MRVGKDNNDCKTLSYKSNSNESFQKWGIRCHFVTLNNVLVPINSVFALMVCVKMGYHFNNLMFFIKKI